MVQVLVVTTTSRNCSLPVRIRRTWIRHESLPPSDDASSNSIMQASRAWSLLSLLCVALHRPPPSSVLSDRLFDVKLSRTETRGAKEEEEPLL